ncbi:hypothetical protein SLEP1_g52247 [Rubroshorea leprosula]|uniref:Uncharacterized protein n=1 Tax=Rubroshorea leprosula TaxID=152421 RepID=A0AAV5M8C3_9ROSI|nr:hypothetical protein SLEP1_g52247 [Rubroshorea leprosula]
MMVLCATTLFADVSLGRGGRFNFRTRHWSQILRTISILSGSLAIISLLSIIQLYVALVSLLVWLLLATHLTSSLIQDLNQPLIPSTTSNRVANFTSTISESINMVFGTMKNWATNLFQRCTAGIPVINIRNLFDRRISGTATGMVGLPV